MGPIVVKNVFVVQVRCVRGDLQAEFSVVLRAIFGAVDAAHVDHADAVMLHQHQLVMNVIGGGCGDLGL